MHFTKSQIEEIRQRLAIQTKKDSEFPDAEIPLDGSERLPVIQYIPLVQDWENRLLSFADMRRMVLSNIDMELVGCVLTVNCETTGATITIRSNRGQVSGSTSVTYNSFYGEVVTVTVEAEGYDMWYESVTMTQDHTLNISLNLAISEDLEQRVDALSDDVDLLKDNVDDLSDIVDGISLVSRDNAYYTLTIGGTSVDFYSKPQIDAMLDGRGSGDATPDDPEDAYLHFTKNTFLLDASGNAITPGGIGVDSNISWSITAEEMPDIEHDEEAGPSESTALNVYPQNITVEVGKTIQINEV